MISASPTDTPSPRLLSNWPGEKTDPIGKTEPGQSCPSLCSKRSHSHAQRVRVLFFHMPQHRGAEARLTNAGPSRLCAGALWMRGAPGGRAGAARKRWGTTGRRSRRPSRCAHTHSLVPSGAAPARRGSHTRALGRNSPGPASQLAPSAPRQRRAAAALSRATMPGTGQPTGSGQRSGRHGLHPAFVRLRCGARGPGLAAAAAQAAAGRARVSAAWSAPDGTGASAPCFSLRALRRHPARPATADWPGLHRRAPAVGCPAETGAAGWAAGLAWALRWRDVLRSALRQPVGS